MALWARENSTLYFFSLILEIILAVLAECKYLILALIFSGSLGSFPETQFTFSATSSFLYKSLSLLITIKALF